MNRFLIMTAAVALGVFATSCAKPRVAVDHPAAPTPNMTAPAPAPASTASDVPRPTAAQPTQQVDPSRFPDAATRARIDELLGHIQDAYFDYDRHTLTDAAMKTLNGDAKELAQILGQYPDYKLQVEGYCDERGSAEYNLALGEARARAAKDYLVTMGVSSGQLSTISYGKERQICDEHDEACWSRNRRIHIVALAMK
jgi:peptidoglycan-associated lipoprotein